MIATILSLNFLHLLVGSTNIETPVSLDQDLKVSARKPFTSEILLFLLTNRFFVGVGALESIHVAAESDRIS